MRNGKIPRTYHSIPPKFHLILPKFHLIAPKFFSYCSEVSHLQVKKRSLIEGESQDEVDSNGNGEMPLDGVANPGVVVVALVATVDAVAVPRSNDS